MTNYEIAKVLAEQEKPCSDDYYNGFMMGALKALNHKEHKYIVMGSLTAKKNTNGKN